MQRLDSHVRFLSFLLCFFSFSFSPFETTTKNAGTAVNNQRITNATHFRTLRIDSVGAIFGLPFFNQFFLWCGTASVVHRFIHQILANQKRAWSGYLTKMFKRVVLLVFFTMALSFYLNFTEGGANTVDRGNIDVFVKIAMGKEGGNFSCGYEGTRFHQIFPNSTSMDVRSDLVCFGEGRRPWCNYGTWERACWAIGMSPIAQSIKYDAMVLQVRRPHFLFSLSIHCGRSQPTVAHHVLITLSLFFSSFFLLICCCDVCDCPCGILFFFFLPGTDHGPVRHHGAVRRVRSRLNHIFKKDRGARRDEFEVHVAEDDRLLLCHAHLWLHDRRLLRYPHYPERCRSIDAPSCRHARRH